MWTSSPSPSTAAWSSTSAGRHKVSATRQAAGCKVGPTCLHAEHREAGTQHCDVCAEPPSATWWDSKTCPIVPTRGLGPAQEVAGKCPIGGPAGLHNLDSQQL